MDPHLIAAAVGAAAFGLGHLLPHRSLKGTQRRKVAAVETAGDVVRIRGAVQADRGPMLRAPITGRSCVAWSLRIVEHTEARRDSALNRQRAILDAGRALPFEVRERTGVARVDQQWVDVAGRQSRVDGFEFAREPEEPVRRLFAARDLDVGDFPFMRLEAIESVVSPGDLVDVGGVTAFTSTPDGYRGSRELLCLEPLPSGKLPVVVRPRSFLQRWR